MKPIFPPAVLSQHVAILGKTGSGKTSTAKLAIEQIVHDGSRVCILDPIKSDWWGLTSSADGKKPGLPFCILGGPRGHVPLHSQAGKAIAEIVASGSLPLSIIDMADFGPGGQAQFFIDFSPVLLRKMKGVLYLVMEEAHLFAPKERSGIGQENMAIHWAKTIAQAGRSKGIRLIVLTQRTQALHNAILGGCETIITHRLTAPADQKPVLDWLAANTDKETKEKVAASLSSLKTGEGWLCSGEAQLFERRQFPRIATYDNSATPTDDSEAGDVKTAAIDQDKLRGLIGAAVDLAKADDPKELRKKIADLERQLKAKPSVEADPEAIERACQNAVADASRVWADEKRALQMKLVRTGKTVREIAALAGGLDCEVGIPPAPSIDPAAVRLSRREHSGQTGTLVASGATGALQGNRALPSQERQALRPRKPQESSALTEGQLTKTQQRIIDAIAWYESLGTTDPTLTQIGAVALIDPTGGHFSNTVGPLSTSGLVERGDGRMSLTDAGRSLARPIEAADSLDGYHDVLRHRIRKMKSAGGKTIEMLNVIIAAGGADLSVEEIGTAVGIDHTGGHFSNMIGPLGTAGLIKRSSGKVTPTDVLFPEGLS